MFVFTGVTARKGSRSLSGSLQQGLKKPLFCVPTDELLGAKDDLLSEGGHRAVSCIRYSKMRKFRPKMRQDAFGMAAGLRPDPLGELERSPGPLAAIGGAYF